MAKLSNDPELVARAFMDDSEMEERASYLARGRRHQAMTDDQVQAQWVTEFTAWVTKGHLGRNQDLEDIRSELGLRNLEAPWELVSNETAALEKLVKERIHNPSLLDAIDDYLKRRRGGN